MELLSCDKPGLAQGRPGAAPGRPASMKSSLRSCLILGQAERAWDPWRGLTPTHSAWPPVRGPCVVTPTGPCREQGQQPGVRGRTRSSPPADSLDGLSRAGQDVVRQSDLKGRLNQIRPVGTQELVGVSRGSSGSTSLTGRAQREAGVCLEARPASVPPREASPSSGVFSSAHSLHRLSTAYLGGSVTRRVPGTVHRKRAENQTHCPHSGPVTVALPARSLSHPLPRNLGAGDEVKGKSKFCGASSRKAIPTSWSPDWARR